MVTGTSEAVKARATGECVRGRARTRATLVDSLR